MKSGRLCQLVTMIKSSRTIACSELTRLAAAMTFLVVLLSLTYFKFPQHDSGLHKSALPLSRNDVLSILNGTGADIRRSRDGASPQHAGCNVKSFGSRWGGHALCEVPPSLPCNFISFGISKDYSFDEAVAKQWGCRGFALDPSVTHPAEIVKGKVLFIQAAASTLPSAEQNMWLLTTTVPSLRKWLDISGLAVLKMDCEGCEYALARDVQQQEPDMWSKVDQFAVEIHVSKKWITSFEHLHNLALLFKQLADAGFTMLHAPKGTGCAPSDEAPGCPDELVEVDFPGCRKREGGMCFNMLYARV